MSSEAGATSPSHRRARALAGLALLVVAVVVVVGVVATGRHGHRAGGSRRTAFGAATVERRNLVTSEHENGKISYANPSTVANRLQGTLTWVPPVGRVISPGQKLFDVNAFPVTLMDGTVPAYRTLDSSDSTGPDIQQLNANLIDLGLDPSPIVSDDAWQAATTAGVEALQEAVGVPQTGSLTLGTVVFLRGAQRIASVAGSSKSVSDVPTAGHAEFVDDTSTASSGTSTSGSSSASTGSRQTAHDQGDGADKRAASAITRLDREVGALQRQDERLKHDLNAAKSRKRSNHSSHGSGDSGPASGGDSPVMTTTSTNLVVTANVSAGQQGVAHVGARVPVVMPAGDTVYGHVVDIGQATSAGGGGGSTVPITIHLDKHENGRNLDQATVSVTFIEKTARQVLSVPVTALLARPGGRYAVQDAAPPHTLIDVTLGTFATGYVQVSGRGLHPGLRITDSQG